ncbi:YfdX family protein [Hydrogenimonas thermophila]|uniref:YfdX protein n=1 Tax=Hydrogenimonas thermophila TaxID=223786 RepID=A0A1I5S2Q8_9BACT|nr:YfdX family protein [Hydrogenimonas thermophila]WOE70197.1 YfdX family protein [Hydrogenimonas thermophila]WOE72714.1 YfdX family protein [Hydrogenimonas thermophila]SFP64871.1 YfdX protein [Hydrogenimonas thermophila]
MKKVLLSLATTALLCTTSVMATTSAEISKNAVKSAKSEANNQHLKVVKEAVEAVFLTKTVLNDLEKKDLKRAKKDLESAIGKLEVILAHKNAPLMLPIDSVVKATEYSGDLKSIKTDLELVNDLIDDGKVQEARRLLNRLQSEIDIITINLPLVSYPAALKLAAKYLQDNKLKEAKDILEMALGTLVQNEIIIPLPLLKAEALIDAASKIAKSDKNQALKHIDAARNELKIAEALGYTSSSDTTYKILDEAIDKIEKEIKGKNRAEKLFEELITKLKEFKDKAIKNIDTKESEK